MWCRPPRLVLTLRLLFVVLPITRLAVLLFPHVGLTTTIGVTNRAGIAVVIALRRSVLWATSDVLQLNSLAVRQHEGDPRGLCETPRVVRYKGI